MILRYTDRSKDEGVLLEDFPFQYFTQSKMRKLLFILFLITDRTRKSGRNNRYA